jgi:hypothetical protein
MEACWNDIEQRMQALIIAKQQPPRKQQRIPHQYRGEDQVFLIKKEWDSKFCSDVYKEEGPFDIVVEQVQNNRTVKVRKGRITDTYNIRMITP